MRFLSAFFMTQGSPAFISCLHCSSASAVMHWPRRGYLRGTAYGIRILSVVLVGGDRSFVDHLGDLSAGILPVLLGHWLHRCQNHGGPGLRPGSSVTGIL